jgi:hypothetical protein
LSTRRSVRRSDLLVCEGDDGDAIRINRDQAAALIPALQEFVREGGV